jgi:hypothetical protein
MLIYYGLRAPWWLLITACLAGIAALVIAALRMGALQWPEPDEEVPGQGPELIVLSSPRVNNVQEVRSALSSIGLDCSEPVSEGAAEVDLVRAVPFVLRFAPDDFVVDFQKIVNASGGVLTDADRVTFQVALRSLDRPLVDNLALLNSQLDPQKGQFFYVGKGDNRIVFLTPRQYRALSLRGWELQAPPDLFAPAPTLALERRPPES